MPKGLCWCGHPQSSHNSIKIYDRQNDCCSLCRNVDEAFSEYYCYPIDCPCHDKAPLKFQDCIHCPCRKFALNEEPQESGMFPNEASKYWYQQGYKNGQSQPAPSKCTHCKEHEIEDCQECQPAPSDSVVEITGFIGKEIKKVYDENIVLAKPKDMDIRESIEEFQKWCSKEMQAAWTDQDFLKLWQEWLSSIK